MIQFFQKSNLRFLILLLVVIFLLGIDILLTEDSFIKNLPIYQEKLINLVQTNKSTAKIFINEGKLNMTFNLTPADLKKASTFSQNLGVETEWVKGVSLELDQNSLSQMSNFLPIEANLAFDIKGKKVTFKSNSSKLIKPLEYQEVYQFATASSSLNFAKSGQTDLKLEVSEPSLLVFHATSSGNLAFSPKLKLLFPTLDKVATIKMVLNGKSVDGEIVLK